MSPGLSINAINKKKAPLFREGLSGV
jgi:hypothetical protein